MSADAVERQVEALVEQFLEQLRTGPAPDRREMVAAHPELGPVLDRRLALVEMMFRAARPAPVAGPPELAVRLKCPHCGNAIQLVQPEPAEVTCTTCGSSIRLEPGAKAARSAEIPKVIGKFQVLGFLGRGAFGTVYKARDPDLDRLVAVKVPRAGCFETAEEQERFLREARSAARLRHPGIVPVHDVSPDGAAYIVSDFIDGVTLADLLPGSRLGFREAAELVAQVADALDYAHREKVIHRDIKPSNILIDRTGRPHLTDFGLARREEGEVTVTLEGQVLGTPAYMSPEQAAGDQRKVDSRSDLYGLGVVLYELLTGEQPFRGNQRLLLLQVLQDEPPPPRRLNDSIPRDLETICLKAMAKEPQRRYASGGEMAEDLRRFLNGELIHARPVGNAERLWRWCRRNPAVAGLLVAVLLSLLSGTVSTLIFALRAQQEATHARNQEKVAIQHAEEAGQEADRANQYRYVAQMNLAQMAWETARVARAAQLLQEQPPRPGGKDLRGWEWFFLHRLCHDELRSFTGHTPHSVRSVAFSPDGRYLASGGRDLTVRVHDVATGAAVRVFKHTGWVAGVAFSPDGKLLASADDGAEDLEVVTLWDVASGRPVHQLKEHGGSMNSVAFSPDGKYLATANDDSNGDNTLQLWDVASGRSLYQLKGHSNGCYCVAFSPDSRRLASSGYDEMVRIWDTATGRPLWALQGHKGRVWSVAFHPDGKRLVSVAEDGTPREWDTLNGRLIRTFKGRAQSLRSATFSPDGALLIATADDQTLIIWDALSGREVQTLKGCQDQVVFSPDGQRLAGLGWDGAVKLWDLTAGREARSLQGHKDGVTSLVFSPDGRRLVSTAQSRGPLFHEAIVWDVASRQPLLQLFGHADRVVGVRFSPDGQWLATAGDDGTVKLRDAASGKELRTLAGHEKPISALAFSPDSRHLVTCAADGTVRTWDVATGRNLRTLRGHNGDAIDARCRWIASVGPGPDTVITIRDLTSGEEWHTFTGHQRITQLAFSPKGSLLASTSEAGTVKVWDVADRRELLTLRGHENSVTSVAFSSDDQRLLSGSLDGTIKVWDVATGQEVHSLKGNRGHFQLAEALAGQTGAWPQGLLGGVHTVAFSPDGQHIAAACQDPFIRLWEAPRLSPEYQLEREARGLVEFLLARPLTRADVRVCLWENPTITEQVRQKAVALLDQYGEESSPSPFQKAAWAVARLPHAAQPLYRRALMQAETACRLEPQQGLNLTTLGMAQYRLARYKEAVDSLTRAEQLLAGDKGALVANLAFLAMARHQSGEKDKAQAALQRLRGIMKGPDAQDFLREAEEVLQAPSGTHSRR